MSVGSLQIPALWDSHSRGGRVRTRISRRVTWGYVSLLSEKHGDKKAPIEAVTGWACSRLMRPPAARELAAVRGRRPTLGPPAGRCRRRPVTGYDSRVLGSVIWPPGLHGSAEQIGSRFPTAVWIRSRRSVGSTSGRRHFTSAQCWSSICCWLHGAVFVDLFFSTVLVGAREVPTPCGGQLDHVLD